MAKKVTRKDFYMEIRKSPGRFLSILFIVALGVAFFSGIRASEPDMRITGDTYFDASELMDIKALSTYGVTEDDVQAMEELDDIEKAEGAYSEDFIYRTEDEQHVLHVMGIQKDMNQVTVTEGRLPEKVGECLVDDESEYEIGEIITLESGTDDPVSDTLKTDTLKVVGKGNSPCYLSYGRGSTTIGTGSISAFLVVPEDTFELETYTEVYLQVKGAKDFLAFTDEYDDRIDEVLKQVEELADERGIVRRQEIVDEAEKELADAKDELEEGKETARKELADAEKEITDAEQKLADGKKEIEDGRKKIEDAKKTLESKQKELDKAKAEYNSGKKELEKGQKEYEKGLKEYEASKSKAQPEIENAKQQAAALQAQISEDENTYQVLTEKISELEALGDDPGEEIKQQIEALKEQAAGISQKIAAEKQAYETIEDQINQAEKQLKEAEKKLAQAKKELDAGKKKLKGVPEKLKSGQKQIDEGWEELESQEKKLNDGAKEIEDNEKKLADAKKEYEDGKKEAEQEIKDGEKKIKDAEKEIEDIENPKWYVYDRSTLVEYSGFGENAERLGAIGRVFPVLFFLVAALISLTSMTRMVEEQRTSIGTMKALGYGKVAIASKYLGYAFLATIGGSVLGVLIGEKILPYIIVYAYGILYRHLPEIIVPYNWTYAFLASGAAIFCTMFATWMACYNELRAQPAVLMRPPTPKNGRRVFMEHIHFVWKHLSFTWKSTIRNLMRYKKRFFMTIFGIGGCMALMLVGFGLKDSCYEIADLQYAEIQLYDGNIYLEEDVTEKQREDLEVALDKEKNVQNYTDVNMQSITLVNGKKERAVYECVFKSVKDVPKFVDFHDRKTKEGYELSDNGVIISEKTAKLLEVEEGDIVCIKDEEKGNKEIKIEHICENYMGHYMYMTPTYYEKVYNEEPDYNSICFIADDACDSQQIEEIGKNMLEEEGVLSVSYTHDIEKQLADMLKSLNLVIVVLIISAGMLAFVVLYNLNTVNIAERKRELATLKVLGFYNSEVAEYVYRENIILTFIGAFVGVGLGKILHRFIIETVEVDSAMFGRNINMPSYIYSLLFTIAFSLIINGIMYFKLKKIDMVESLKSIE
ncbi:MAG: FtsX-like permease family protein [Lachnospiraceae bacterium]